jgi:putative methionine-R-sulfoxide reductase with GAF domain
MFPFLLGDRKQVSTDDNHLEYSNELRNLERHSWRNWIFLVGGLLVSSVGIGIAFLPTIVERAPGPWPWINTNLGLIIGYVLLICVFVGYLTYLQFKLVRLKRVFQGMLEKSSQRNQRNTQRVLALFAVSHKMGRETDLQKVFDYMTEACKDTFKCNQASLMLFDNQTNMLTVHSASGHLNKAKVIGRQQKLGEGVAGWAALHRQTLLLNKDCDVSQYEGLRLNAKTLTAAMVVPIILRDELVGVVNVSSRSKRMKYTEEDMSALKVFAENAGTCIRHAEHVEWMRETIHNLQAKLANASKSQELKSQPSSSL